jgi:SAM-dependent methyltransferase
MTSQRTDYSEHYAANRASWDERVPIHVASRGYDREGFLRGEKSLCPVEQAEMGDVRGKTLLHLQCHFGMDTLNWARLGATVTGLDFSAPAIEAARALSEESGIPGRFVQTNVYDAHDAIDEQFDVVYTGIGALNWLPDIRAWAQVAAGFVKPGGFLYVYEGHPMLWSLDDERDGTDLVVACPYFERPEPMAWDTDETYVDGPPLRHTRTYEWNHGLGEIVTAILDAGLRLEFLHEHRELPWKALHWMEPVGDGGPGVDGSRYDSRNLWRLPAEQRDRVPLMYSLKATRPA